MIQFKTNINLEEFFIAVIAVTSACVAASSLSAATIPSGTTLTVQTLSPISSQDVVGRNFEVKIVEDVSVNGNVLLRAGTKAFGKIRSSRANPRRFEPLTVDLTWVSVNGRNVAIKTNSVQPEGVRTTRDSGGMDILPAHWWSTREASLGSNLRKQFRSNRWFAYEKTEGREAPRCVTAWRGVV